VYASLPLHGALAPQGVAVLNGVKLALGELGHQAGSEHIRLVTLDDSSGAAAAAADARAAGTSRFAVFYIGELDSAMSQVAAPILNQAGVAQVSPLSTSVSVAGLDPAGRPTFLRLAPPDSVQAAAQLSELSHRGCRRVGVVDDGTPEGRGLAGLLEGRRGISRPVTVSSSNPGLTAARIKSQNDDCVVYAGWAGPTTIDLLTDLAAARPRLLLGSYGVCTASVTEALPLSARRFFRCTAPLGDLDATAAGREFVQAYRVAYGSTPDPLAVYGYEAMKLAIDTISRLGNRGDDKSAVRSALFGVRDRVSAIGAFGFTPSGSSTAGSYGLYDVGTDGAPSFLQSLRP
jgi:branched-chain amino acid transport system substrate-binding protein